MSKSQTTTGHRTREIIYVTCEVEISYTGEAREDAIDAARSLHLDVAGASQRGCYGAKLRDSQIRHGTYLREPANGES